MRLIICAPRGKMASLIVADAAARDNVEIVHEDILKFDWSGLGQGKGALYIAGNLPYYITTPILLGIFERSVPAKSITVMVQKKWRSA